MKLQVVVYATTAVSVNVSYRQRINGEYMVPGEPNIAPGRITTDGLPNYFYFQFAGNSMNTAELVNAAVGLVTANIQRGQCFVRVGLTIGGTDGVAVAPFRILFSDYLTSNSFLAYPGTGIHSSLDGRGYISEHTVTDPAAGSNFTWTAPASQLTLLHQVYYGLETSAAVANRRPAIAIEGTVPFLVGVSETTTAASSGQPIIYSFIVNGQNNVSYSNSRIAILGRSVYLEGVTFTGVSSAVDALDAGDQISTIGIITEQWIKA